MEIRCDVVGGSPPIAPSLPTIAARVGLDRAPLDVTIQTQSRWQLACVWPDTGRLPRTRLALEEARRTPLELVRGDAVEDVGDLIASLPTDATAVVTTTWVVAYFSPEQRTGFPRRAGGGLGVSARGVDQRASGHGRGRPDPQPTVPRRTRTASSGVSSASSPSETAMPNPSCSATCHPHGSGLDWRAG